MLKNSAPDTLVCPRLCHMLSTDQHIQRCMQNGCSLEVRSAILENARYTACTYTGVLSTSAIMTTVAE